MRACRVFRTQLSRRVACITSSTMSCCAALWPAWHAACRPDKSADRHHNHRKRCHRGHIRSKCGIPETFKKSEGEVNHTAVHGASQIDQHLLASTLAQSPNTTSETHKKLEVRWTDRQPPRWNVECRPRCCLVVLCPQMISCCPSIEPKERASGSHNPRVGHCAGCELLENL